MLKGKTWLRKRTITKGSRRYDQYRINIPTNIVRDSAFPIEINWNLNIRVEGKKLVIEPLPRFEHFNTLKDHATIRDNKLDRYINVYPRPNGKMWCELCDDTECEHIEMALTVPEIVEPLKRMDLGA